MDPYNQQYFQDHTGYGPTPYGSAPSIEELRRSSYNRHSSNRARDAMRYQDVSVTQTAEQLARMAAGKDRDPATIRRNLHGTTLGQGFMDAAAFARKSGYVGPGGDPTRYSDNVMNMVAGGFTTDIMEREGDSAARKTGFGQRVSGGGMLTERAGIMTQGKMLDNLYGKGQVADSSKLSGYNMEDASVVAQSVVGRGGMGPLLGVTRNANFGERLRSTLDSAQNPGVIDGLSGLSEAQRDRAANIDIMSHGEDRDKAINEMAKELSDPKAQQAFKDVMQSTDAITFNDAAVKKVTDTVKEVTKGMAALSDIYGGLSTEDALAGLEKIAGGRITNKAQAKAASRTVDTMRNTAEYAGMDPKMMMDMAMASADGLKAALAEAVGSDSRTQSTTDKAATELGVKFTESSVRASKSQALANKRNRDSGIEGFEDEGLTPTEIAADKARMALEATEQFQATTASYSDKALIGKTPEEVKKINALQKKIEANKGITDQDVKDQVADEQEMKRLLGGKDGWEAVKNRPYMQRAMMEGAADDARNRELNNKTRGVYAGMDVTMAGAKALGVGAGMSDADAEKAQQDYNYDTLNKFGGNLGLSELAATGNEETKEDRANARKAFQQKHRLSDEEMKEREATMFDSEGKVTDAAKDYMRTIAALDRTGGADSDFDLRDKAQIRMDNLQKNEGRRRVESSGGGLRGIAKEMFKDKNFDAFGDVDTTAASLDMLTDRFGADSSVMNVEVEDEEGKMQTVNMNDMRASGVDLTQGLNQETLDKFDKVAGRKLNLRDKINKERKTEMTEAEFLEFSKGAEGQEAIYKALDETEGVSVGGAANNMTLMDDRLQGLAASSSVGKNLDKVAALQTFAPMMGEGQLAKAEEELLSGGQISFGDMLGKADEYDANSLLEWDHSQLKKKASADNKFGFKEGEKYTSASMKNAGNFDKLVDNVNTEAGSEEGRQRLQEAAKLDPQGFNEIIKQTEAQIGAMETAISEGDRTMTDKDGNEMSLNNQVIEEYKLAMAQLKAAMEASGSASKVGTMTVEKMEVINYTSEDKK
jgi:MoxR-like ATPase